MSNGKHPSPQQSCIVCFGSLSNVQGGHGPPRKYAALKNCTGARMLLSESKLLELRKEVAAILGEQDAVACTDEMILRYSAATGHKDKTTVKRLVASLQWRKEQRPECLSCKVCTTNHKSHYMHPVGHDRIDRPVLFSCYSLIEVSDAKQTVVHMIQQFELATKLMVSPGVQSWVWVMDFMGFGRRLADFNPTLGTSFIDLSADHYPERLGQLLVIDAPALISPLWNMMRPLIDPVTHTKIRFLPYDPHKGPASSKLLRELGALFEEELASWILKELDLIRQADAGDVDRPEYDLAELRALTQAGTLLPGGSASRAGAGAGAQAGENVNSWSGDHCHYGCKTFLKLLQDRPELLAVPREPSQQGSL